jgi:hypothetical protein
MAGKPKIRRPMIAAKQIGYCLKHLQDGTALRRSALIKLPVVARLAAERYRGSYWGCCCALRDILVEICTHLGSSTGQDPGVKRLVTFIQMYSNDAGIAQIARTLGVSRPTVYRMMPAAFNLVAEELERYSALQGVTTRYT